MIEISDKKDCSGCTACCSVCGHEAIIMKPDGLGFLYPHVDVDLCTECNLCVKVCPFKPDYKSETESDFQKTVSFRLKDEEQLSRSQSGGAFYSVAKKFMEEGGIVYGVSFNDSWRVVHRRVEDYHDLESLRYSKYIQSDLRGIIALVKSDLKKGLSVLFTGTPCQVAGIKAAIPVKFQKNLFCIDIICHGVPSPKVWDDYLKFLKEKENSDFERIRFRDKRFGWHGAVESFLFKNGKELFRGTSNYLYFYKYSVRDSCSNCHFTNLRRVGDLTIGDFWGLPKESKYNDEKGISQVLINTKKGQDLLDNLSVEANILSIPLSQCMQPQLQKPIVFNKDRSSFIKDYQKYGFVYVAKRYGDMGVRYKFKKFRTRVGDMLRWLKVKK